MRFAHLADCHVGSWRDPVMKNLNLDYFSSTIDEIISENEKEKISFVIISGDLFNTAVPSVEALKIVTKKLMELKKNKINCYGVSGSHDYSASGKSMLTVLEEAGLFYDLCKGKEQEDGFLLENFYDESNALLTGISGKMGSLEKKTNYKIKKENEFFPKIFVFHSAITEFLEKELEKIESMPFKSLPDGFDYYAGGHVHYRLNKSTEKGQVVFPGPVCPNNFKEWLDLKFGTFVIVDIKDKKISINEKKIELVKVFEIDIDANNLEPKQVFNLIESKLNNLENTLVLLKVYGKLKSGVPSDIRFDLLHNLAINNKAVWILRNTLGLNSIELEKEKIQVKDMNEIEDDLIDQNIEKSFLKDIKTNPLSFSKQKSIIKTLINIFSAEKQEGESIVDFESRIEKEFEKFIENEI